MAILDTLQSVALLNLAKEEISVDGDTEASEGRQAFYIQRTLTRCILLKVFLELHVHFLFVLSYVFLFFVGCKCTNTLFSKNQI